MKGNLGNAIGVDAPAVIGNLHHHLAGFMPGVDRERSLTSLAGVDAIFRRFDAVIDGVAHHVRQRIRQGFDQAPVESYVLAANLQLHILGERCGQVAHQPGKLSEHVADGLEPRLHDGILQFGGDLVDALVGGFQGPRILLGDGGAQLIAPEHQLAGQIHQHFESSDVHPDAVLDDRRGRLGSGRRLGPGGRGCRRWRFCRDGGRPLRLRFGDGGGDRRRIRFGLRNLRLDVGRRRIR